MPTILIIDDSLQYRADLVEILEFEKYHTLEAGNGLAGLQMIRRFLPDLIICDVDMPVMNGIDVLKAVKADSACAKIPFLVATGRADTRTRRTLLDLGADTYLTKPISISEFLVTVGSFLWEKDARPPEGHAVELRRNPSEGECMDHSRALY